MVRAVFYERFGGPEVLQVGEVEDPKMGPDTVLVDVTAVGLNPVDSTVRAGHLAGAFDHHFPIVPAWDVAGTVVAVGPAVTAYAPGDAVFGYARLDVVQHGTAAAQVSVPERVLAPAPTTVDLVTAAAVPLAGLTAHQVVFGALGVGAGQTVLVHAAAGGVGQFAVQLAVSAGARVVGTASPGNHDHLRSIGAEPVPYGDGLAEAVRALVPGGVDVVVDLAGGDALEVSDSVRNEGSRVASVVDAAGAKARGGAYVFVRPSTAGLTNLARRIEAGTLRVDVARTFPLEQAAEAYGLLEQGHVRGKLVLTL